MDPAAARARLERMTAADSEPVLDAAAVDDLMVLAARVDAAGHIVEVDTHGAPAAGTTWVPTYNLAAAAAEGWRWKAGKAVENTDASADGASFRGVSAGDCLAQAAVYDRQAARSSSSWGTIVPTGYLGATSLPVVNL